jgi:hypothetical protein
LPSKGEDFTGKTATAIGWGKLTETDAVHSDVLREVNLQIISNTLCQVDRARIFKRIWSPEIESEESIQL